jgi:transketolase
MNNTREIALQIRQLIIKMLTESGSGHTAGPLGMADVFSVLYFSDLLHLSPAQRDDPSRDRVILSNGHICPVWYATLALRGYFPAEELDTLRQFGSRLQGHPHRDFSPVGANHHSPSIHPPNLPGIENTAGPLGQGIGFAVGVALGLRRQSNRVICLCGDGELDEGQCWEAFMTAAKYKLTNLTFIIDRNDIQIDGFTHDVMPLESLKDKLASFGLFTIEIDGHNHEQIYAALKLQTTKPTAIIIKTIPGKGVSFMEGKYEWHGKTPNRQESEQALKELC